jgi:hypothetical protein
LIDVENLVEALNRAKMFNKMEVDSQKPFSVKVEIEKYQRGSENFRKFITRFVERMRRMAYPQEQWVMYLEAALPRELKSTLWNALREGRTFEEIVGILRIDALEFSDWELLQRWKELKQRQNESAPVFYYRFKETYEELKDIGILFSDKHLLMEFQLMMRYYEEIIKMRPVTLDKAVSMVCLCKRSLRESLKHTQ